MSKKTSPRQRLRELPIYPSILTLGNLLCGFAAIFYASRDPEAPHLLPKLTPLMIAASLIFVGMIFDALDGMVARMTNQTSEFGGQLDSMADMVTFGAAPAFLVLQLVGIGTPFFGAPKWDPYFDRLVLVVAGIYVACCGLRLARFNIENEDASKESHMWFKGLPSPGAAGAVASLVLLNQYLVDMKNNPVAADITAVMMVGITFLVALGMVSNMKYVHAANRYLSGKASFSYIVKVSIVLILLIIAPLWTLASVFVLYVVSAPVITLFRLIIPAKDKSDDDHSSDEDEDHENPLRMTSS